MIQHDTINFVSQSHLFVYNLCVSVFVEQPRQKKTAGPACDWTDVYSHIIINKYETQNEIKHEHGMYSTIGAIQCEACTVHCT